MTRLDFCTLTVRGHSFKKSRTSNMTSLPSSHLHGRIKLRKFRLKSTPVSLRVAKFSICQVYAMASNAQSRPAPADSHRSLMLGTPWHASVLSSALQGRTAAAVSLPLSGILDPDKDIRIVKCIEHAASAEDQVATAGRTCGRDSLSNLSTARPT